MVFVAGVFLQVVLGEFIGDLQDLAGVAVVAALYCSHRIWPMPFIALKSPY